QTPEGATGLGRQQVKEAPDTPVILQFFLLLWRQKPVLVLHRQFMHPCSVLGVDGQLEDRPGRFRGQVVLVGLEDAAEDLELARASSIAVHGTPSSLARKDNIQEVSW